MSPIGVRDFRVNDKLDDKPVDVSTANGGGEWVVMAQKVDCRKCLVFRAKSSPTLDRLYKFFSAKTRSASANALFSWAE